MLRDNDIFSKKGLEEVSRALSEYTHNLLYWEDEPTTEQIQAGNNLLNLKYILAAIEDYIFDYNPYQYLLNEEQAQKFPEFFNKLKSCFNLTLSVIDSRLEHDFLVVDTVSTEGLLVERESWREEKYESSIRNFLNAVKQNSAEIEELLLTPKKTHDPSKPTEQNIRRTIKELEQLKSEIFKYVNDPETRENAFAFYNLFEQFRLACMFTFEKCKYGDHTYFFDEGDSLLPFMMFEIEAGNIVSQLRTMLVIQSPFVPFENIYPFTRELTKIINYAAKFI